MKNTNLYHHYRAIVQSVTRLIRLLTVCAILPALVAGCGESDPPDDRPAGHGSSDDSIQPIPFPDLGRLEAGSRLQVEQMHERVEALADETHPRGPLLAKAYGELGKLFNAHLLDDAAAVCYRNAELLAPEDYRWTYYRAHLFRRAGKEAIAIRGLQRGLALMKQDVSVEPQQFVAALTWLGTLHQSNGDYAGARLMYEQAIKVNPRAVVPKVGLAQLAAAEGDHATAIESLEAIKSGLRSGSLADDSIRYQLAMSYRALGDMDTARTLLDGAEVGGGMVVTDPLLQAMRNSVTSSTSLVRRGNAESDAGRVGAAAELYRQALEVDPENYIAHLQLAWSLGRTGGGEEALDHLERAAELQPESAMVWGRLSRALRRQGQVEPALAALETARRLDPGQVSWDLDYARMLLQNLDRPGDALSQFEQVLEREPANVRALAGRATALERTAGCEASLAALEEAHARVPSSHLLTDGLARTLLQCGAEGGRSRALILAEQAFEANAGPRYAATVAMALAVAGDFERAVRVQREAIELARNAGRDAQAQQFEGVLRDFYLQGRPWRPAAQPGAAQAKAGDDISPADPAPPGKPE